MTVLTQAMSVTKASGSVRQVLAGQPDADRLSCVDGLEHSAQVLEALVHHLRSAIGAESGRSDESTRQA